MNDAAARRTLSLTLAYEGTAFAGWQRQPAPARSRRWSRRHSAAIEERPVTLVAAGRTDAGVHASGPGGQRRRGATAGSSRADPGPQRAAARRRPRGVGGRRAARLRRPPRRAGQGLPIHRRDRRRPGPFVRRAGLARPAARSTSARWCAGRGGAGRRARLRRVPGLGRRRADLGPAPPDVPPRGRGAARRITCAIRSPAPASSATWSATSSAPWWTSARAAGRPRRWRRFWRPASTARRAGMTAPADGPRPGTGEFD